MSNTKTMVKFLVDMQQVLKTHEQKHPIDVRIAAWAQQPRNPTSRAYIALRKLLPRAEVLPSSEQDFTDDEAYGIYIRFIDVFKIIIEYRFALASQPNLSDDLYSRSTTAADFVLTFVDMYKNNRRCFSIDSALSSMHLFIDILDTNLRSFFIKKTLSYLESIPDDANIEDHVEAWLDLEKLKKFFKPEITYYSENHTGEKPINENIKNKLQKIILNYIVRANSPEQISSTCHLPLVKEVLNGTDEDGVSHSLKKLIEKIKKEEVPEEKQNHIFVCFMRFAHASGNRNMSATTAECMASLYLQIFFWLEAKPKISEDKFSHYETNMREIQKKREELGKNSYYFSLVNLDTKLIYTLSQAPWLEKIQSLGTNKNATWHSVFGPYSGSYPKLYFSKNIKHWHYRIKTIKDPEQELANVLAPLHDCLAYGFYNFTMKIQASTPSGAVYFCGTKAIDENGSTVAFNFILDVTVLISLFQTKQTTINSNRINEFIKDLFNLLGNINIEAVNLLLPPSPQPTTLLHETVVNIVLNRLSTLKNVTALSISCSKENESYDLSQTVNFLKHNAFASGLASFNVHANPSFAVKLARTIDFLYKKGSLQKYQLYGQDDLVQEIKAQVKTALPETPPEELSTLFKTAINVPSDNNIHQFLQALTFCLLQRPVAKTAYKFVISGENTQAIIGKFAGAIANGYPLHIKGIQINCRDCNIIFAKTDSATNKLLTYANDGHNNLVATAVQSGPTLTTETAGQRIRP